MSERDAFGPNLRRIRVQRGLSLEQLADSTKVSIDLWKGLERNDFTKWPTGIYARSYVRDYANAIGVDPETTVNDFCRWFPQGDRRVERQIRGQAEIVGHDDLHGAIAIMCTRRSRSTATAAALPRPLLPPPPPEQKPPHWTAAFTQMFVPSPSSRRPRLIGAVDPDLRSPF